MKLAISAVVLSLALGAAAQAQSPEAPPPPPDAGIHPGDSHGPHGGPGMFGRGMAMHHVEPVSNAPLTAQFTETANLTDRDGKQQQRSSSSIVYRDSQGRVREEITLPPPPPRTPSSTDSAAAQAPSAPRGPRTVITILDPVAHTITHLQTEREVAVVQTVPADFFTRMQKREDASAAGQPPRRGGANATTTALGSKVIGGFSATGEQVTMTLPGRDGGQAHTITRQTWFSPDEKIEVSSSETSDRGTRTDTLTSFSKAEPNPSLFQVPAGYTTRELPEHRFGGRRRGGPQGEDAPDGQSTHGGPGGGEQGADQPPPPSM